MNELQLISVPFHLEDYFMIVYLCTDQRSYTFFGCDIIGSMLALYLWLYMYYPMPINEFNSCKLTIQSSKDINFLNKIPSFHNYLKLIALFFL